MDEELRQKLILGNQALELEYWRGYAMGLKYVVDELLDKRKEDIITRWKGFDESKITRT